MSKPSTSFAQPAKKSASAKPRSGGGGQRAPLKKKHLVLAAGGMAAGLVALWPFMMEPAATATAPPPVASPAPVTAPATPAPAMQTAGNSIPTPTMQPAVPDAGPIIPVAADWKHGWIASAHTRDGAYDLLQVTQPPVARWVDPEVVHLSTDHLAAFPARNPYAPAGQMREGVIEFPMAQARTLAVYLYPTRALTAQRCATRVTVNGATVIEQANVPLAAGAQNPVGLVSTPFPTDGTKVKVTWWTQCMRADDRGQPTALEWANAYGATGRLSDAVVQGVDPVTLLGAEWRLLTSDASNTMPRLVPAEAVWHDGKDAPKTTKATRNTVRTGGPGDPLPPGVKSGWRVEAIPYGPDWQVDVPGQPVARTFEAKGSVITTKDHYLGDTLGGPFVYHAKSTWKIKEPGLWQVLVAVRTPDRRPDFLHCGAKIDIGEIASLNRITSTALGGSGLVSGLAKLDVGTIDTDIRLACMPAGERGFTLTPEGFFAPGEHGAVFSIYVKGPNDDVFRTPRNDEFTFKAK